MNKQKLNWIFEALVFILENNATTNAEEKRMALLNEADSIEVDEETMEEEK